MSTHAAAMKRWIDDNPPDEKGLLTVDQVRGAIRQAALLVRLDSWEALGGVLSAVPEFSDPMGPLGPLWIAVQMELGKPVRAGIEHMMVAEDVQRSIQNYRGTGV